uniref:Uncharacterized protein n=1 Tax=Cucumis melo TaxID=3656 RepID=A0A9I9E6F8_CUCME
MCQSKISYAPCMTSGMVYLLPTPLTELKFQREREEKTRRIHRALPSLRPSPSPRHRYSLFDCYKFMVIIPASDSNDHQCHNYVQLRNSNRGREYDHTNMSNMYKEDSWTLLRAASREIQAYRKNLTLVV